MVLNKNLKSRHFTAIRMTTWIIFPLQPEMSNCVLQHQGNTSNSVAVFHCFCLFLFAFGFGAQSQNLSKELKMWLSASLSSLQFLLASHSHRWGNPEAYLGSNSSWKQYTKKKIVAFNLDQPGTLPHHTENYDLDWGVNIWAGSWVTSVGTDAKRNAKETWCPLLKT